MATSRRFLGNLDAEDDPQFKSHFLESHDLYGILNNNSDVIYGSKGVGKTALMRALTELNLNNYYATKTINLDQISFKSVHTALINLKNTTQTGVILLARNTWRNIFAVYCLEAVAENLSKNDPLRRDIESFLTEEGFEEENSNNKILSYIDNVLYRVGVIGIDDEKTTPLGLTKRQRHEYTTFPYSTELKSLLERCTEVIKHSNKYVLICLDGFDTIIDHTPESRKEIFAGLIDAIHKVSKDKIFTSAYCFKAFLPHEFEDDTKSVLWDADKYIYNTHHIRWVKVDFQNFLIKRLYAFAKTKSLNFSDIWSDYMPEKIRNEYHKIDENSFDYILRHTLYRPRQVLTHIQLILDKWDFEQTSFKVDPSFIPQVVSSTNYLLSESVIMLLENKHPGLSKFMRSFNGMSSTMLVNEFYDQIRKIFQFQTKREINDLLSSLYNSGIIGIAYKNRVSKQSQRTLFRFAFVGGVYDPNIHAAVSPTDIIAFSPMLDEYCGCELSHYGAVIPSDR